MLGLHGCPQALSSCSGVGGSAPVAVHELLSVEASLVAEHRLYAMCASVAVVRRLRCSVASGIFPDQGWNLGLLQWQADSQPLDTREVPFHLLIIYRASAGAQTPGWVQIGPCAVYTISTSSRNLSVSAPRQSPFLLSRSSPPAFRPFFRTDCPPNQFGNTEGFE